jgi:putative transcriptional regulator
LGKKDIRIYQIAKNIRREAIVFPEKNKYNPSLKLAHSLAKLFEVKIEELFLFDE